MYVWIYMGTYIFAIVHGTILCVCVYIYIYIYIIHIYIVCVCSIYKGNFK